MNLHIFDDSLNQKYNENKILIWNGEKINRVLENNKKIIRTKYLNIIHNIIESYSLNYKYFRIRDLNLFKMSLINEKNPFKSSAIFECLKLLALEIIIKKKKINKIIYHGKIDNLHKSLKDFCINQNINYEREKITLTNSNFKLIFFLTGIFFFLKQLYKNFNLEKKSKKNFDASIISYFVHFDRHQKKKFQSNLWGDLIKYLNTKKISINWFHFYIPSGQVKKSYLANSMIKNFNLNKYENHNFVNSVLNLGDLLNCFLIYFILFVRNIFFLKNNLNFFLNKYSKTNFYYFLEKDLMSSFFGSTLIYNIMHIVTFDNLLKNIPKQKFGIYIIENQSWEYSFIKLWKKYNHGKLFAYFNSSIRFWDLRYLKKKNELRNSNENPDVFLINSNVFKSEIKKLGYPMSKVFVVEALRYKNLKPIKKIKKNKKILIVGDILFKESDILLKFVGKTIDSLKNYKFYFKPHPTMTLKSINLIKQKYKYIKVLNLNTNEFKKFEFVICSNGTSANLDCLIQKLNFCSVNINNTLNLYPIGKYQKLFQAKGHTDLINRIKYPKNIKFNRIFNQEKNCRKFLSKINEVEISK